MHEAFETNNWYNDISTRDRSREGAEEAIDSSRRFQKPELIPFWHASAPRAPQRERSHAGTEAVSVLLPER